MKIRVPVIGDSAKLKNRIFGDPLVSFDQYGIRIAPYVDQLGNLTQYNVTTAYMVFETQEAADDFCVRYPDLLISATPGVAE